MTYNADVILVGGGLAGLTCAIHLAMHDLQVLLFEKQSYPHHKVCGEYVSNEVLPYLTRLGIDVDAQRPSRICSFLFSTEAGKTIQSALPLGGFGLSRYAFDQLLYARACGLGVSVVPEAVNEVQFAKDIFQVKTASEKIFTARLVVGAYGKRTSLDKQLNRPFVQKNSPWMGVKAHYRADFPDELVSLHNFDGGYCGISRVENGVVNVCYLTNYASFQRHKNLTQFQEQVLSKNPFLRDFFRQANPLFDKPLTISQISFARKAPVENHMLMCGDSAGVIHPLCGNGMAMAIHSAKLAAERIVAFHQTKQDRTTLETGYTRDWNHFFRQRLTTGRAVQAMLLRPLLASTLMRGLQLSPNLLPALIRQTHGQLLS